METSNFSDVAQDSTNTMDGRFLTFYTDNQLFSIPISHVVQIIGMQEITEIPEFPEYAKGIINLRGNIIPVIDVRLRFGKPEAKYDERTCIIVTNIDERSVGFIVDGVAEVTNISDEEIAEPPKLSYGTDSFLIGIGKLSKKVVLLIDVCKILKKSELNMLTDVDI